MTNDAPGTRSPRTRRRRGVALVIVLVVLAIMTVTVGTFMYQTKMEINMIQAQVQATQAYFLARSGVWRAVVLLRDDLLKDRDVLRDDNLIRIDDKEKGILFDSYYEPWGSDLELLEDIPLAPDRAEEPLGTFTVKVFDECGRIDLNRGNVPLLGLQHLLTLSGVEEEKAPMIAAAILDYRDGDDELTLPEETDLDLRDYGDQASEVTFYNPEIDPRDFEFTEDWLPMKNADFDTAEELLMVPGMDYYILFGEDANHNGELDDNEDDGDLNLPYDNADGELYFGIADYITVSSYAKANLNTVPQLVLEAILFESLDKEAEDAAEQIARYRDGRDRILGTDDDVPFMRWTGDEAGEGKAVDELELPEQAIQTLRSAFDLRSDTFRVVSSGRVGGVERQLTVVVSRRFYEAEQLVELYDYLFEDLGGESPDLEYLTAKQREQVKFTLWDWDDYSFVDFRAEAD